MHIHTKYSMDSFTELKTILKMIKKRKLDGVAVTDHDTTLGGFKLKKMNKDKDIKIIVGSEIKTNKGEVLALFLNEEIKQREFYSVLDEIRRQDGIAVAPHPFDPLRRSRIKELSILKELDGVECLNARTMLSQFNRNAFDYASKNNKMKTAGSDAHFWYEIGLAYTEYRDNLRKSLLKGTTSLSMLNFILTGFMKRTYFKIAK